MYTVNNKMHIFQEITSPNNLFITINVGGGCVSITPTPTNISQKKNTFLPIFLQFKNTK